MGKKCIFGLYFIIFNMIVLWADNTGFFPGPVIVGFSGSYSVNDPADNWNSDGERLRIPLFQQMNISLSRERHHRYQLTDELYSAGLSNIPLYQDLTLNLEYGNTPNAKFLNRNSALLTLNHTRNNKVFGISYKRNEYQLSTNQQFMLNMEYYPKSRLFYNAGITYVISDKDIKGLSYLTGINADFSPFMVFSGFSFGEELNNESNPPSGIYFRETFLRGKYMINQKLDCSIGFSLYHNNLDQQRLNNEIVMNFYF